MAKISKARVLMSGRSPAVRIPAEFRFTAEEVYGRRDPQSGDLILSQAPGGWDEIFAALDAAAFQKNSLRIISKGHRRSGPICDSLPDRYQHYQLHVDSE